MCHEAIDVACCMPYHAARLRPLPVLEIMGRTRDLAPVCKNEESVWCWWQDSNRGRGFSGKLVLCICWTPCADTRRALRRRAKRGAYKLALTLVNQDLGFRHYGPSPACMLCSSGEVLMSWSVWFSFLFTVQVCSKYTAQRIRRELTLKYLEPTLC